jgi:hypothetical protein
LDENYRPDVRSRPHLPRGCGKNRIRADTWHPRGRHRTSARTQSAVRTDGLRADADAKKIKKVFLFFCFLGSCCHLEKREKNFGFQSPRSPSSPSSAGFMGEAARRRRFFGPSSPSHPSKLYSSLGLLNSKVPKPFSPFSLRLIDVDGF